MIPTFPGRWAGTVIKPSRETEAGPGTSHTETVNKEPRLSPLCLFTEMLVINELVQERGVGGLRLYLVGTLSRLSCSDSGLDVRLTGYRADVGGSSVVTADSRL